MLNTKRPYNQPKDNEFWILWGDISDDYKKYIIENYEFENLTTLDLMVFVSMMQSGKRGSHV